MISLLEQSAATPRETKSSRQAWRTYDSQMSEEEILKNHLPLVRSVVDRMRAALPSHIEVEDLYSVGLVGLIHSARKFDPSLGVTFAGFAVTRIRGAVLDELRRMDWMSRSSRGKAKKLSEAIVEVEQRLGRPASEEEMASELSMTTEDYAALLDEVRPVCYVALDDAATDDAEGSLHDIVADESQDTASDLFLKKEMVELVVERMQRMPDMQKKVLAMYYFENLRLAEIAAAFGVTESRICQIHSQAVLTLRTYIKTALNR